MIFHPPGAAALWLLAALVLGIAELAVPGIFLVFVAIAAAVTGVIAYALPDLPLVGQLAAFAVWSAVAVLIGRRWYRDFPIPSADALLNDRSARLVGQTVTVETAIVGGHGRVRIGDGSWPARGEDAGPGEAMRVTAVHDGVVNVVPIHDEPVPDRG